MSSMWWRGGGRAVSTGYWNGEAVESMGNYTAGMVELFTGSYIIYIYIYLYWITLYSSTLPLNGREAYKVVECKIGSSDNKLCRCEYVSSCVVCDISQYHCYSVFRGGGSCCGFICKDVCGSKDSLAS